MDKNEMDQSSVLPQSFTTFRVIPAILLFAIAFRFSMAGLYTQMALLVAGAVGAIAQLVFLRDKKKAQPDAVIDVAKANRYLISLFCVLGAGLAYINGGTLIASLTLLAGFGQFWFMGQATAGERLWHGFQSTILTIVGYALYRPLMYVCLPISILLALDFIRLQKKENETRKELLTKAASKRKKKKRKK